MLMLSFRSIGQSCTCVNLSHPRFFLLYEIGERHLNSDHSETQVVVVGAARVKLRLVIAALTIQCIGNVVRISQLAHLPHLENGHVYPDLEFQ